MSDTVIQVENLGKKYVIGHQQQQERYTALRDVIANRAKALLNPFQKQQSSNQSVREEFWALKDVSFEIKQGDRVGIIGRNGAGKSTLLKILSRITEPTTGNIRIRGRVASLLEVGTGFHPELTGRENIYLNGAILGMTRLEIKKKFDEIVAFAEVEKFLDTPVKRYSSGMYVRLAFAVAAHLEPEILVVDEVLAVGDAQFQKKCLGKMEEVGKEGRTILFVSHNMGAIQRLCTHAIVLSQGRPSRVGEVNTCIRIYLESGLRASDGFVDLSNLNFSNRRGNGLVRFEQLELLNQDGERTSQFRFSEPFRVRLTIVSHIKVSDVILGFSFVAIDGTEIQGTSAHDSNISCELHPGTRVMECNVNPMLLTPGRYYLRGAIFSLSELYEHIDEIVNFDVMEASNNLALTPSKHYVGYVYFPYNWSKLEQNVDYQQ